ncbi:MAG: hypothetical protein HXN58_01470 [Prevotella pallens]|nr:hypothetical protein [Prevotella pallens]MBF1442387.1 hypothetical protein [Prevotella pallens]MBF1482622.1 hypothetical protein [Prevotella pallens]MBF1515354.1 hypothetical protein [Prevotella pallens]
MKRHLWIYEATSMDIRSYIYGYTKLHLWIYEVISMDIRVASYRYLKRN